MRTAVAALLIAAALPASALPSFDEVQRSFRASDLTLLDRHGAPLQVLRIDDRVRRGPWVPLAEVSPALRAAVVLGEDRRFWDHAGVDWPALVGAAWDNLRRERVRGGSTLTMQLAGLLDEDLARPAGGRSLPTKLAQMARAREIESRWTKPQIFEAWLNLVPLRGDTVGVPAAAWALFGKRARGLDSVEAALVAALVRAPNAPAAAAARRACELLQQQRLACTGVETAAAQAFARRPGAAPGEALAPHFARAWRAAGGGERSTLDAGLQRLAREALARQRAELRGRNVDDGAAIVIDNASGEVRAWVGSADGGGVDAVLARRQPGSTLKPFLYALAFERRLLTPASRLQDTPLEVAEGGGLFAPQNYDKGFKGEVGARVALASSLNVPAVRVAGLLGPDALFEGLQRAGLGLKESAGFHGSALALGSAETTLADLANAYRALANGGRWQPLALPGRREAPRRVVEPGAAWLVADILADNAARAVTFGFDSPLATRGWAAVKTGTSKDLRDNWCLGFTDRYTVGVWMGNAGGEPMHAVSGSAGAAPVWHELVAALHAASPSKPPPAPASVVRVDGESFLAGTGPAKGGRAARFGIDSPREGSLVVLDPDIPAAQQRLVFSGAPGRWSVDGQAVGEGERVAWLPRPGRHELRRQGGGSVETVAFEVRFRR
ncbi:MAG: penicillin-binding protein 1C [Rubrivivax sp.]